MLNEAQISRMLEKLKRLEQTLAPYIFTTVGQMKNVMRFETTEQFHEIPPCSMDYQEIVKGDRWGGEGVYCWFLGTVTVPEECRGKDLFIKPEVGGREAMLWVEGKPSGVFTHQGNHYCDLLVQNTEPDREIDVALEYYAGHYIIGTDPFETAPVSDFIHTFGTISLCMKNQDIADFIFDLRTLNQLAENLDKLSFRRADIINCLIEVHKTVWYAPEDVDEGIWRPALARARQMMRPTLEAKNALSAPTAGLIGHSHMDTAWLWPISETIKKCARTYSNQISLMKQYPEYRFIQSSAFHGEVIRRHYPELFDDIREKVLEGRYEPNGAVWVECDCNITSGESMVRQFLWGQRFTQKHFNYSSNCFWLPDTFGYSASIPQIMKLCGVDYFLTTKMSWNDTNRFPYETFNWKGIDGTVVFTHFNTIHYWPDPKTLLEQIDGRSGNNYLQNKQVSSKRLISYGHGDGGGGPQFEMIEMARRVRDLDGCARAEHINVSDFMKELEYEAVDPPVYRGELYLELHRGTLTSQHEIKRNNRKAEQALHNLEALSVWNAVSDGVIASDVHIHPLMETMLVNQFHDILPGTSIATVNDQCYREMSEMLQKSAELTVGAIRTDRGDNVVTVLNTLGFARVEEISIDSVHGMIPADQSLPWQISQDIDGTERLCIGNVKLPPFGGETVVLEMDKRNAPPSAFVFENDVLTTPFARVTFEKDGTIGSYIDTRSNRELRGGGMPLNTFLMAEDVPWEYDNWDIDADCMMKFKPVAMLLDRRIISFGSVQFRIRSVYSISEKSTIRQNIVFHSGNPRVDFETVIDWQDKHRFLKVDFNTSILSNTARHEIQFGCCQKPTTRNNTLEQAMFEVVNHKYTDISETRYGVALLNDCKYGISVQDGDIQLSLQKSGCRPDARGDAGVHRCTYALLPHIGGFSAENVVLPAYALNYEPLIAKGRGGYNSFASIDASNVIIETIKPCEDNEKAFILRLYEAEGTFTHATLALGIDIKSAEITNMLEETLERLLEKNGIKLDFRPFEIKTIKFAY